MTKKAKNRARPARGNIRRKIGAQHRGGRPPNLAPYSADIQSAIDYLAEKRSRPANYRDPHAPDDLKRITDSEILKPKRIRDRLDLIVKHVKAIDTETQKFDREFTFGLLDPYMEAYKPILRVQELILSALGPLNDARVLTTRPPKTKANYFILSAVRLADGICGVSNRRQVRAVAKAIIDGAKLAAHDVDRTISNCLKSIRKENGK